MSKGGTVDIDFDVDRLNAYLGTLLGGTSRLQIERTQGGMSNPTYFLKRGDWQAVLRKQPAGKVMPSAHAIDREYRVLNALHGTDVPVPRPLHYCFDQDVLGTPFYLMERLQGRVFHEFSTPGLDSEHRSALFDAMVSTMAAIHRLDVAALGLGDYGRPGNYFARQLKRWSEQWFTQYRKGDEDNPALDRLVAWLGERVPDSAIADGVNALKSGATAAILLGGAALRGKALEHAARIAAKTGCTLISEYNNARMERGAGRAVVKQLPFVVDNALAMLKDVQQLVLVGAKSPVSFFAYPGKPSVLVPEGCNVTKVAGAEADLEGALVHLRAGASIDALFVDMRLSRLAFGGYDVANQGVALQPDLRVLYTSGTPLTADMTEQFVPGARFIQKPYSAEQLGVCMGQLLN